MKADDLIDLIGDVDDSLVAEAKADQGKIRMKKRAVPRWIYWTAAAACLCLVAFVSAMKLFPHDNGTKTGVVLAEAADLMQGITPGKSEMGKKADAYSREVSDFAVRLYRTCDRNIIGETNTLVSPISVMLALSMTSNGMDGKTLNEAEDVLGMSVEKLNVFANIYLQTLSNRIKKEGSLKLANAIWFKTDPKFTVNTDFLQKNADYYCADIYAAPFDLTTLSDINNWVNEKTDAMIPQILDKLDESAIMCLVNATAFDAKWKEPYSEIQIKEDTFTTSEGEKKQVAFLEGLEHLYIEDENSRGFIKPYKGGKYAFAAILPNEGLTPEEYLEALSGENLASMISNAGECTVSTSMPKFTTEYSIDAMADILREMGMTRAFDGEKAEFGSLGTYEGQSIYINKVVHKTFISLDENGTQAGAATAATITYGGIFSPEEMKEVYLTRPFIYMLIDTEANIPLFIGTMRDPEK
ncbi:MAG: serpin family protein [Lachnospiraceae bacterium]|nr:serpin family protein [Lachnospiraceae bacterium]